MMVATLLRLSFQQGRNDRSMWRISRKDGHQYQIQRKDGAEWPSMVRSSSFQLRSTTRTGMQSCQSLIRVASESVSTQNVCSSLAYFPSSGNTRDLQSTSAASTENMKARSTVMT